MRFPRNKFNLKPTGQAFPVSSLVQGLQLYYPFNEGGGTMVMSAAGGAWPATFNGTTPAWIQSRFGPAISLDGSTNYVNIPDPSSDGNTITPGCHMKDTPCTVAGWINWTASTEAYNAFFAKEHSGGGFTVLLKSNQQVAFYKTNGNSDPLSNGTIPFGVWTHLALTDDGTTFRVYINGVLDNATTAGEGAVGGPFNDTAFIGKSIFGGGRFFSGSMAHFGLWSRAITPSEVQQLYSDPNVLYGNFKRPLVQVIGSTLLGASNIVGQGVLTGTGALLINSAGTILGQGVLTAQGGILIFANDSIIGQGVLTANGAVIQTSIVCPRDAVVTLYLVPRATVAVVMPIAYVTSVKAFNETLTCGVSLNTVPVTGSMNTLVELSSVPQNNQ